MKEYGPWHKVYLFYLLSYFGAMIAAITYASAKKKVSSNKHAIILLVVVLVNIGVWLLEQLVKIDFEFLSVSYIISELFLISLYLMMQECGLLSSTFKIPQTLSSEQKCAPPVTEDKKDPPTVCGTDDAVPSPTDESLAQCKRFAAQIKNLTPAERVIFDLYLAGKTTKEIMKSLKITENTLKYHNKNIYGKLGVSSRRQLLEIATALK